MTDSIDRYLALALQTRCDSVNHADKAGARQAMLAAISRIDEQIRGSLVLTGPALKLVVLPEYFMTGYPVGETIEGWADKAAIAPGGAEYDALAGVAQKHGVWLSGNAYETDAHFPGYYFQVCFIIDPSGTVILRYRRLISMFAPTPHDVWDKYLDIYGIDAVFPVAETAIGKLACCASEEILFPEVVRAHALRGAEIILHPTSEVASPDMTPKEIARRARALENLVYVVSANTAGVHGEGIPAESVDGMSKIVDYKGARHGGRRYGRNDGGARRNRLTGFACESRQARNAKLFCPSTARAVRIDLRRDERVPGKLPARRQRCGRSRT